ncbi:F0F1 ATP synthase subunit epsilon [Effusibacillus lacus]|uniref:ATP synthase epsilon chain n=1 Tax=Effusibacillus lacus TaxID=1348429 RepID=A0A292YL25_9BACL|nr:F0F1 ATP synthase subunit epsilon [Effusibacillus lacus]TCS71822.1 ATP synthase F1 subcomplex epsilon subunit [Effusibacillus lacus]GAX89611.1 F0F1 ATP synthase subunit epsilon [Effusibacillus lacus]
MKTVPLEIVTPERIVFSDDVQMVIARGGAGDVGILPGHTPLVTTLKISAVRLKLKDGSEQHVAVTGGFLEVKPQKVTILAEAAELPEEIDIDRAERARERAEARLAASGQENLDFRRAELALQRAVNRLQVAKGKDRR